MASNFNGGNPSDLSAQQRYGYAPHQAGGPGPAPASTIVLFRGDEEEEEDEDEEIVVAQYATAQSAAMESTSAGGIIGVEPVVAAAASQEFLEALQAVDSDPLDISSWLIFLDELVCGRSGSSMDVETGFGKYFAQFPRAARAWMQLAEYHISKGQYDAAAETYNKSARLCRDINLWRSYLNFLKRRAVEKSSAQSLDEQYQERRNVEAAYDAAVDNVGSSIDSYPLWRDFIEFVNSEGESTRKLTTTRKIYQRAVCIPMDGLDVIWRDYETLERQQQGGSHLADKLVAEYEERYKTAKLVYRDRKRLTNRIAFDRLSVPPTKSLEELQQLDSWNQWIRYVLQGASCSPCHSIARDERHNCMLPRGCLVYLLMLFICVSYDAASCCIT
jgi:tetratricopeptide (TPR) repeat protein